MISEIIICDDSNLARKQMARALPYELDAKIHFAGNGLQALEMIRTKSFDLMFLDLTMPVMDGYQVLAALQAEGHDLHVIVVSGDIQEKAQQKVTHLGAKAFIQKPCDPQKIESILKDLPLQGLNPVAQAQNNQHQDFSNPTPPLERLREITNVAMGQAASLLAREIGVFVNVPIPLVNEVQPSELVMAIQSLGKGQQRKGVCQGFVASGIRGEAMLILHDDDLKLLAEVFEFKQSDYSSSSSEILMEVASILISACLKGIGDQLSLRFSQGTPITLGKNETLEQLIERGSQQWANTLAVEIDYYIESHGIQCTLLLLFPENSIDKLHQLTAYFEG
ncbi:response regulator [Alginatibacterium sediminis]|nr:response regulator [Alginatibacterium sediminis]